MEDINELAKRTCEALDAASGLLKAFLAAKKTESMKSACGECCEAFGCKKERNKRTDVACDGRCNETNCRKNRRCDGDIGDQCC